MKFMNPTAIPQLVHPAQAAIMLTLSNVLVMVVNAIVGIAIARTLPTQQYGEVAYLMSIFLIATLLAGFGLTSQVMRDIAELAGNRASGALNRTFYTLLAIRLATGFAVFAVSAGYAAIVQDSLFLLVGVGVALAMLSDFLSGVLRGVQRIKSVILMLWCQPVAYLILLFGQPIVRADQVLAAFSLSFALSVALGSLLLWGSGITWPRRNSFSRSYARASSGFALQLYSVSLLQVAYGSAGTFFLGSVGHYHANGLASVSLTLTRMLPLILTPAIGSVLYPQLCTLLAAKEQVAAEQCYRSFYRVSLLVAIAGGMLLAAFPDTAILLLYTAKYAEATPILRLLAPVSALMVVDLLFTWTLIAHRQVQTTINILAVRLLLLICGSVAAMLAPEQSAAALLAFAYAGSACVGVLMQGWAMHRILHYPLQLIESGVFIGITILLALLCRIVLPPFSVSGISFLGNALVMATIAAIIAIGMLFWAGIFQWRKWILPLPVHTFANTEDKKA
jgi:O-antigen/teichoic acid export membrane protein